MYLIRNTNLNYTVLFELPSKIVIKKIFISRIIVPCTRSFIHLNDDENKRTPIKMFYPLIPIFLAVIIGGYLLYLYFVERNKEKFRQVFGLVFFIAILWIVLYYFFLR